MNDIIFTPYKIGSRTAKNRIIRSATNDHLGNTDGSVSDAEIEMYGALAGNDIGIIITGHSQLNMKDVSSARLYPNLKRHSRDSSSVFLQEIGMKMREGE